MIDGLFGRAVGASLGTHVVGLVASSAFGLWTPATAPPPSVPIEIVALPAPDAPPPPPPRPERTRAPRNVRSPLIRRVEPTPVQPSRLLDETALLEAPAPAPHVAEQRLPATALLSNPHAAVSGLREGGPAGAGALFSTGDLPVRAGGGATGGSGAAGRAGTGLAALGDADAVAAAGVTSFAKPLGGYQSIPRYPESARRAGIEGVTLLRFIVKADGHVGRIEVERSAGHVDLDRSAVEAVKSWLFEPARRGKEAVPVWVTLPVRFALTTR